MTDKQREPGDDGSESKERQRRMSQGLGTWMPIGLAIGVALGLILDNLALGIGVGLTAGVAIGLSMTNRKDAG